MKTAPHSFKLPLSDGWEDHTIYTFVGPDDSGLLHVVTLTIDPSVPADSVGEFARERIDASLEAIQGAEILKDQEKALPHGTAAWECVYKWIPADGVVRFVKNVYLLSDGVGCTFSGTFTKKTIRTIALEMDQMIAAFSLIPEK